MKTPLSVMLLGLGLPFLGGCFTGTYATAESCRKPARFEPTQLYRKENAPLAMGGRRWEGKKSEESYILIHGWSLTEAPVEPAKVLRFFEETSSEYDTSNSLATGYHLIHTYESGQLKVQINSTYYAKQSRLYNAVWTVPLDVVTSPAQLVFGIVFAFSMTRESKVIEPPSHSETPVTPSP